LISPAADKVDNLDFVRFADFYCFPVFAAHDLFVQFNAGSERFSSSWLKFIWSKTSLISPLIEIFILFIDCFAI